MPGSFPGYVSPSTVGGPGSTSSGNIGSGQVGQAALSSGAVQSGQIASGVPITYARNTIADYFTAGETISGLAPVAMISGGVLGVAQGASGLRMPAIGVANANYASGVRVQVVTAGLLQVTSGMDALWSGSYGSVIWVSSSGDRMTPTQPTVATLSQGIGLSLSGAIYVVPDFSVQSGGAAIQSGIL